MVVISVTGTPGTGKTTLSKKLGREIDIDVIDVNKIIKENKLSQGFDEKRNCEIIDIDELGKILIKTIEGKKDAIIDSHLSHYLPRVYIDIVIVTTCEIPVLKTRLEERGYDEDKIRENLDSEIFGICMNEAEESGHLVITYDSTEDHFDKFLAELKGMIESL